MSAGPLKRSTIQYLRRSRLAQSAIALMGIVIIAAALWRQLLVEYQHEQQVVQKISDAGGTVSYRICSSPFLDTAYRYRAADRIYGVIFDGSIVPEEILGELKQLHLLENVMFINTPITNNDLILMQPLTNVRDLWLDGTHITDAGLEHLKGFNRLKRLSLDRTHISDSGLQKLSELHLSKLELLQLPRTEISDEGLQYLSGMTIRELNLGATAIGDSGLRHLKALPGIVSLNLAQTKVTDDGLEYLKGLTSLKELRLTGTKTTGQGIANLQMSLPECKIWP